MRRVVIKTVPLLFLCLLLTDCTAPEQPAAVPTLPATEQSPTVPAAPPASEQPMEPEVPPEAEQPQDTPTRPEILTAAQTDALPAIDWMLIPVGTPEGETLPRLGIDDIIDTTPAEEVASIDDAPLAQYGIREDNTVLWLRVQDISLAGVPLDHVSIQCRGGLVHYVSYFFYARDFADETAFLAAVQALRVALGDILADAATLGESEDLSAVTTVAELNDLYRAYWTAGDYRLELEVNSFGNTLCQLRLRSPVVDSE